MKRYIFTIILVLATIGIGTAQQLPNSSFEEWDGAQFDGNIQPSNWNFSNVTQFGFKFNFAHREAGHTGNYSAMAQDQAIGAAGIVETSPGYFALGQPWVYIESLTKVSEATAGTSGGISFTYRPDSLFVWIKRTGANVDKEYYNIVFYSWTGTAQGTSYKGKNGKCTSVSHTDEESDIRQATDGNECTTSTYATQIAEGWVKEKKAYNDWTLIKVPIYYNSNEKPTKCNVIFSAGNYPNFRATSGLYDGNSLYVDDVELIYSSKIDELYVNNKKWGAFDPSKENGEEQTYALGLGATDIPDIFAKRGVGSITNCKGTTANFSGRVLSGSEITIDKTGATVGGNPVTITVKSEDGKKTSVYKIKFVAEQSSNSRPASISYTVNGVTTAIPNFSGYITNYNIELPYGTTEAPVIDPATNVVKGDDGQTIVVTQATSPTGTAVVKVTAANGATSTYTIVFSVGLLTDNTLQNILIGGSSLPGFSPTKTNYTVELPLGTTVLPAITPVSAYANGEQTITVTDGTTITGDNCSGTYNIAVKAPGNSTVRTYKLSFKITASTYSYLQDLQLDGVTIANWEPENVFTYYVSLPLGTTVIPAITWTKGDSYQTVTSDASSISGTDGTYKITVTAASGAQTIYKIVFTTAKSSVSTLNGIYLDGTLLPGFAPSTLNYAYELPIGTTTLPSITCTKGDAYQSDPAIMTNGINGTTRIIVQAQDGSTSTYTIVFSVKQANSTALKDLSVAGYPFDFDANTLEYSILLNRGTTTLPTITYVPDDEFQKITQKDGGVNGDTKITVKAQTGATATYIIHFAVAQSSNAALDDIQVNGTSIDDFDSETLAYAIELAAGTTALPTITYTKGDYAQTVQIIKGDLNGTTLLQVTAEDGTLRTYSLTFSVLKSANAFLNGIFIDGEPLVGFDQEIFNYTYILDTTIIKSCPVITVDKNTGQSISIVKPQLLGTATIVVTPEVGTPNTYKIQFTDRALKTDSRLNNILLDGIALVNFDRDVLQYAITLPDGTTVTPVITPVKSDESQQTLVATNGLNATSYITVTAENGDQSTYALTFTLSKSDDATLRSIKLDGIEIPGFDKNTFAYVNTLPIGAVHAPAMTFEGNADGQTYIVSEPTLTGTAQIIVTAADRISQNIYTITHTASERSDANIQGIELNGAPITGFAPNTYDYIVATNAHAAAPDLTLTIDSTQYIAIADGGLNGSQIVVTAENGTQNSYYLGYDLQPGNDVMLRDLQIYNGDEFASVAGFAPDQYFYTDSLAWRTKAVPSIHAIGNSQGQTITIYYGAVNDTTTVRVTAEDGIHYADYHILFAVRQSAQTALENLMVDDAELQPEFDAAILDYTAVLPYGTTGVPTIRWEQGKEGQLTVTEQRIVVAEAGLRDTTHITVIAENGDTRTYNITFKVEESTQDNALNYYVVDGIGMFTDLNAIIELPYGSTVMPEITCFKKYKEQTVLIDNGGIYAPTTITVKANRADVADAVYTLRPTIAKAQAALTSISVNGQDIDNFAPDKYQYIVSVDNAAGEQPTLNYTCDNTTASVEDITTTTKYAIIPVSGKDDNSTAVYTVYYFYTQDTIPNPNFEEWSAAATYTSANKPTGWTTIADIADATEIKSSFTIAGLPIGSLITKGTYKPDQEVTQNGDQVVLKTVYSSVLAGSVPGVITLGEMTATLNDGSSSTSVFGGIPFRNTPDAVSIRYNPVSNSNVTAMHFAFSYNNGNYLKEFYDSNFSNTWKTKEVSLLDNTIETPALMNIIINSCESENSSMLQSKAASEVLIDWVRFAYNSQIANIYVNGQATSGFQGKYDGGWIQAVKIDADLQGAPVLTFEGVTRDQEYTYSYGDEQENCSGDYKTRVVNITSKAEDGTLSRYIVNLNRPLSANADLQSIIINGDTLNGFAAKTFNYTINVANGTVLTPDITAIRGSMHQTIRFATNGLNDTIIVTAENGFEQRYVLTFAEQHSNDATLADIAIEGDHSDFTFDAATDNYEVRLGANATLPKVTYQKRSDGQSVTLSAADTTRLIVTAENGIDTKTYTIRFVWDHTATSGKLANLAVVANQPLQGFDKDLFDYHYNTNEQPATICERLDATDTITQTIAGDSVIWYVRGTESHTYKLTFDRTPDNNTDLATILVNGTELSNFNVNINEYFVETNRPVVVHAIQSTETQHITAQFELYDAPAQNGAFAKALFTVTAEDGLTQNVTTVYLRHIKSDNALLAAIMLNGDTLRATAPTYTADRDFAPNAFNYNITLHCANPKIEEPAMPHLTFVAGDAGQTIQLEYNGLNATSYITVTAEDQTENIYTLNFVSEKSGNADLTGIAVNNVAINDFQPNITAYEVTLTQNAVPEISYTTADRFQQQIELTINLSQAVYTVTAENGTTKTYTVRFNAPTGSHNALLNQLEVDAQPLADFAPETTFYSVLLPAGTETLPSIGAILGEATQTVVINYNDGLRDTTDIVVTAGDGYTQQIYQIYFDVALSDNSLLDMIYLRGDSLLMDNDYFTADRDFETNQQVYNIVLPIGTRTLPNISYTKGDKWQTITVDTTSYDTYAATIILDVIAEKGNSTQYTLNFVIEKSAIDTLNNIYLTINGIEEALAVAGTNYTADNAFAGTTEDYHLTWQVGTRDIVTITYDPGDTYQTVEVLRQLTALTDTAVIRVTAENGNERTYTIYSQLLLSTIDSLKNIFFNDIPFAAFDADTHVYNITLPHGSTTLPIITWEQGDAYQSVELDSLFTDMNGHYTLTVTAENGNVTTYTFNIEVAKSSNALLNNILTNGIGINGFIDEKTDYTITLPYGTTTIPEITWETGDDGQTVVLVSNGTIDSGVQIIVTAEDGTTTMTYSLTFAVALSDNALLNNIFIGGEALDSLATGFVVDATFESQQYEYNVVFPYGTKTLPAITWEAQLPDSEYKSITLTNADDALHGTSVITVVSQDELQANDYMLHFSVALSDNNKLNDLYFEGIVYPDFDPLFNPDTTEYKLLFELGSSERNFPTLDNVRYVKGDEDQTVTLSYASMQQDTVITNATIELQHPGIVQRQQDGNIVYDTIAAGTLVTVAAGDTLRTTIDTDNRAIILVSVQAQNGATNVYVVSSTIAKSNNSLLKDLVINGVSLKNFEPETFDYTYIILRGSALPTIEGIAMLPDKQSVEYGENATNANIKYIYCIAEDGSSSAYTITFVESDSNPGDEPTLEDVCWTALGGGAFKASTSRNGVSIGLFDTAGRLITLREVPLVDPNDNICEPGAAGVIFQLQRTGKVLIYAFYYNGKKVIAQGKFIY
ncbi:MAG: hypothetical protein ACI392_08320 [Paludibacteraceae bacterium]